MNDRYTALPLISMGLRILGYVVLALGILSFLYLLLFGVSVSIPLPGGVAPGEITTSFGFWNGHVVPAFSALIEGFIRALLLLGASELIHVLLDIEENTRPASADTVAPINEMP